MIREVVNIETHTTRLILYKSNGNYDWLNQIHISGLVEKIRVKPVSFFFL